MGEFHSVQVFFFFFLMDFFSIHQQRGTNDQSCQALDVRIDGRCSLEIGISSDACASEHTHTRHRFWFT